MELQCPFFMKYPNHSVGFKNYTLQMMFSTQKWLICTTVALFCIISSISLVWADKIDLSIIASIESSNNPLAYNAKTQAIGLYQITPICLKEYNNYHSASTIAQNELYKPQIARLVAEWYVGVRIPQMLKFYGLKDNLDNRLICYNAGIGNLIKGIIPDETQQYIFRYRKLSLKNEKK